MTCAKTSFFDSAPNFRPLTPRDAAEFLGLDEKTITRWARKGYLPGHPLEEGKRKFWRFIESELSERLAAKNNGAHPVRMMQS